MKETLEVSLPNGKKVLVEILENKIIAKHHDRVIEISIKDIPIIEAALTTYYRKKLIEAGKKI